MHSTARRSALAAAVTSLAFAAGLAHAQHDPRPLLAAQTEAMKKLSAMDGTWRGTAWTLLPSGDKRTITQTERIGPMLGGSIKVIEGRGYNADGSTGFNAFAVVSFDPQANSYSIRSYAQGMAGDFKFAPTANGYEWEIPMGPAKIRYTATITGNRLVEVGDREVPGQPPMRFFEMDLQRIGNTDWPAGNPVAPK